MTKPKGPASALAVDSARKIIANPAAYSARTVARAAAILAGPIIGRKPVGGGRGKVTPLRLAPDHLAKIDAAALATGVSRSAFIRDSSIEKADRVLGKAGRS